MLSFDTCNVLWAKGAGFSHEGGPDPFPARLLKSDFSQKTMLARRSNASPRTFSSSPISPALPIGHTRSNVGIDTLRIPSERSLAFRGHVVKLGGRLATQGRVVWSVFAGLVGFRARTICQVAAKSPLFASRSATACFGDLSPGQVL